MNHQDWNSVIMNKTSKNVKNNETSKHISQKVPDEETKMEAPSKLGQLICQMRTTKNKTQKVFAGELGISPQVLSRWETNKEVPTNADLAKIERLLGIKLPRNKKVKTTD